MKVVVTVPEEYMGDVIGDINSRRGQIQGMEAIPAPSRSRLVRCPRCSVTATDLRSRPRAAASTPWSQPLCRGPQELVGRTSYPAAKKTFRIHKFLKNRRLFPTKSIGKNGILI